MSHAKRQSRSPSGERNVTGVGDALRESSRPPFRSKILPVILAATLGFAGAGFFAFRDIARAQASADVAPGASAANGASSKRSADLSGKTYEAQIAANTRDLFTEGRDTFRFDTFGDEDFWGGVLQLHQAIEGEAFGGVGPGITRARRSIWV